MSYLWQPGGMTTASINIISAGSYNVVVTNSNNCSSLSSNVVISQNTAPANLKIQSSGPTSFCDGGSVNLSVTGGTNNYLWSPGGSTSNSLHATKEGTYYVYSIDSTGQVTSRDSIKIQVNPVPLTPEIRMTYIPNTAYQLTAFEPSAVSYAWSNGQTTSSVNIVQPQSLTVRTTNTFGCVSNLQQMTVNSVVAKSCVTPDMLTAYNLSDTSAILGWNPAVTCELFIVKYWENGSSTIKEVKVNGSISIATLPNLAPGTAYRWYVQASCVSGLYQSAISLFSTLNNPLSCGSVPEHLRAINIKIRKADLVWFSTIAESYQVRYRNVGSTTWITQQLNGSAYTKGTTLSNLSSNKTYEWQVQTTCKGYTSPYSLVSMFSTLDTCGDLGTLSSIQTFASTADIQWTNTAPMSNVRIKITDLSTGMYSVTNIKYNPSNGIYTVKNLKPNRNYSAEVRGICTTGIYGPWSNTITFITSNIIARIENQNPLQLNGFPNPTSDRLSYSFITDAESDYILKVCDFSGRELMQETRKSDIGDNAGEIPVNNYAKGIYLLIVQKGTETSRFRFAVQ